MILQTDDKVTKENGRVCDGCEEIIDSNAGGWVVKEYID